MWLQEFECCREWVLCRSLLFSLQLKTALLKRFNNRLLRMGDGVGVEWGTAGSPKMWGPLYCKTGKKGAGNAAKIHI